MNIPEELRQLLIDLTLTEDRIIGIETSPDFDSLKKEHKELVIKSGETVAKLTNYTHKNIPIK